MALSHFPPVPPLATPPSSMCRPSFSYCDATQIELELSPWAHFCQNITTPPTTFLFTLLEEENAASPSLAWRVASNLAEQRLIPYLQIHALRLGLLSLIDRTPSFKHKANRPECTSPHCCIRGERTFGESDLVLEIKVQFQSETPDPRNLPKSTKVLGRLTSSLTDFDDMYSDP